MGFDAGSVTFRRFAVVGQQPGAIDEALLEKLSEHAIRPGELGVPEELEYGFSGGRHVLDGEFSFNNNVFTDCLHFALRLDTNKVPAELKKAWLAMEEEAAAKNNPSGFISKLQKKDAKDAARRRIDDELRSGRFRQSKLVPILWDVPKGILYSAASNKAFECLSELFERAFGLSLEPLSAGSMALRVMEGKGKRRDYEDLRPTRFVIGPEGDGAYPEYAWVAKGAEPKDFLGNEFLLWLWHEAEGKSGSVHTPAGEVTIMFERTMDLDCAYAQTGKASLKSTSPARMPEAREGIKSGKVPRKAGLLIDAFKQDFGFTLSAEAFTLGAARLPQVEDAETPRALFEERISLLGDLCRAVDGLFETFLKARTGSGWEGQVQTIRRWVMHAREPAEIVA